MNVAAIYPSQARPPRAQIKYEIGRRSLCVALLKRLGHTYEETIAFRFHGVRAVSLPVPFAPHTKGAFAPKMGHSRLASSLST